MKDVVLDEVMKDLNFKERIIVKLFSKTFYKIFNISRILTLNKFLEK